jgi:hypothetical protein
LYSEARFHSSYCNPLRQVDMLGSSTQLRKLVGAGVGMIAARLLTSESRLKGILQELLQIPF